MNKTVSITISGMLFSLEEQAFDKLENYLKSLKQYFENEEGGAEIVNDIEARIAELFEAKLNDKKDVISLEDVADVIALMGQPWEMVEEEEEEEEEKSNSRESSRKWANRESRKIFRNPDDAVLGGVCSGLGAYLNIDPVWIRLFFALVFLTYGTGLLLYIILWIAIPEAQTTADKLRMKGKPVNVSNIEESFKKGAENIRNGINDLVNDPENRNAINKGTRNIGDFLERFFRGIGQIIMGILRIAFKFASVLIIAVSIIVLISLFLGLFTSIGLVGTAFHEFLPMIFPTGIHGFLIPIGFILFIGIPLLLLLIKAFQWLFSKGAVSKTLLTISFILWMVTFFFLIGEGIHLALQFRSEAFVQERDEIALGEQDRLYISSDYNERGVYTGRFSHVVDYSLEDLYIKDNKLHYKNVSFQIESSPDDEYYLIKRYESQGSNYEEAVNNASGISYTYSRSDTGIILSPVIALDGVPFRGQRVALTLLIPEGKEVVFTNYTHGIENDAMFFSGHYQDYPKRVFKMSDGELKSPAIAQTVVDSLDYVTYSFSAFDEIDIESAHYLEISMKQGNDYEIQVSNELDQNNGFSLYQQGDKLRMKLLRSAGKPTQSGKIHLRISCPDLDKFTFGGNGSVNISQFSTNRLALNLAGAVKSFAEINAYDLSLELNGIAEARIKGTARELEAELGGSCQLLALDLICEEADLELAGMCEAELFVSNKLNVEAHGSSSVRYKGSPEIRREISGISSLKQLN